MGTKITELAELTTPAAGDFLPIVDASDGNTKKVDVANLSAGGGTPYDDQPMPVTNSGIDPGESDDYARGDHRHQLGTLVGANFAAPVLQTSSPDLGDSGAQLLPGGLSSGGDGGGVDLAIAPGPATTGQGKGLSLKGGVGATNQNGGPASIDAGGPNGSGVGGNVRIGRDNAVEVLIGRESTGSVITLEGTTNALGSLAVGGVPVELKSLAITAITHTPAHSLTTSTDLLLVDNSGGSPTINLPNPTTCTGRRWLIKITSTSKNPATLTRFGSEQINGRAGNRILRAPHGTWALISDGTNWHLFGKNRLDLVYTVSDTLVVEAGWRDAEVYIRCGASGGSGGGGGGGSASAAGGGGGKGGGCGGSVLGLRRPLLLPAAGTNLTVTVGAGGAGGAGGAAGVAGTSQPTQGTTGSAGGESAIYDGATPLLRHGRHNSQGAAAGAGGNPGVNASGGSAGGGGTAGAVNAQNIPPYAPAVASSIGNGGGGGPAGAAGTNGASASESALWFGGPFTRGVVASSRSGGQGGAQAGGTHGGGGGGGAGARSQEIADMFSHDGIAVTSTAGLGGYRVSTQGDGGAANAAGGGGVGQAGQDGQAGTDGLGGGGGQGGGGAGGGTGANVLGGVGGAGGAGSDGLIVITVWE